MDVHHHAGSHHAGKKGKEYFLEFLMIFLAVFLGFIAENIREHITARVKEKQYMAGFVRNIKDDTADLRRVIAFDDWQVKGTDSMLQLAHADMRVDANRKAFYYLAAKYFYRSVSFKSNDATLQQLKSTGDYRLIEKNHVADSLTRYDADINSIYSQGAHYTTYFKEILSRLEDLVDLTVLSDTSFVKQNKMTNKPFPALRTENGKLVTFFNKVYDFRVIIYSYAENNLKPQLENSISLLAFLKKEYGIKDEKEGLPK